MSDPLAALNKFVTGLVKFPVRTYKAGYAEGFKDGYLQALEYVIKDAASEHRKRSGK